jgi:hypothetical protein
MKSRNSWFVVIALAALTLVGVFLSSQQNAILGGKPKGEPRSTIPHEFTQGDLKPVATRISDVRPNSNFQAVATKTPAEAQKSKVKIRMLTRDGKISAELAAKLEMTPSELSIAQAAVDSLRAAIAQHAAETARLIKADTGALVIRIPPMENSGDNYDHVFDAFQRALGSDRFNTFLSFDTTALDDYLHAYGAEITNLTIEQRQSAAEAFQMLETRATGGIVTQKVSLFRFESITDLPENYRWIDKYSQQIQAIGLKAALPK